MEERIIELSVDNRSEVIKLPINPKTVEITSKQLNQTITLLECSHGKYHTKGQGQWSYRSAQYQRRWKSYGG